MRAFDHRPRARSGSGRVGIALTALIALGACAAPATAQGPGDDPGARVQADDQAGDRGELRVVDLGLVAPDVVAVTIRAGNILHGGHVPYSAHPGDRID